MEKLNLEMLKERGVAVVSNELLNSIHGGIQDHCHCDGKEVFDHIVIIK